VTSIHKTQTATRIINRYKWTSHCCLNINNLSTQATRTFFGCTVEVGDVEEQPKTHMQQHNSNNNKRSRKKIQDESSINKISRKAVWIEQN
jgi:hypothetical protein